MRAARCGQYRSMRLRRETTTPRLSPHGRPGSVVWTEKPDDVRATVCRAGCRRTGFGRARFGLRRRRRQARHRAAAAGKRPDRVPGRQFPAGVVRDRYGEGKRTAAAAPDGAPRVGREPHGASLSSLRRPRVEKTGKTGGRGGRRQALATLASPDFGQAQADARRAQSDFALAEKNLNRLRELHAAGVSSRKDLATAEADHARADAELARAMSKVKLYGATTDSVDQNFSLASPIDGVIVERNINPGQELRPDLQLSNMPAMFVITDPARLWVQLDAAEGQLASLRPGKKVQLRSAAWPDQTFTATLENISDFIDPATRSVKVRGSVENRERKLKGEMFVTAELEEMPAADLQMPEKALVLVGDNYYVFVEERAGRYSRQEVKVDAVRDGIASVASGVKLGQKVVIEGNLFLHRLHRQLSGGAPA